MRAVLALHRGQVRAWSRTGRHALLASSSPDAKSRRARTPEPGAGIWSGHDAYVMIVESSRTRTVPVALLPRESTGMSTPDDAGQSDGTFDSFALFDDDGDGLISAADITRVVRDSGLEITDTDAVAIVAAADADGDGLISRAEFDAVRSLEPVPDGVSPAEDAFAAFDSNGDGFISLAELEAFAEYLGYTADEATAMMTAADADNDGQLSLTEFVALLTPAT